MPSDLAGGTYRFTIDGLTDTHYGQIAPFDPHNDKPKVVRLYLYWRDTNASPTGYLANLAGLTDLVDGLTPSVLRDLLVAELAIVSIARQVGERHYETVITAQERAFKRLADKRLDTARDSDTHLKDRAVFLAQDVGVPLQTYGFNADGSLPTASGAAPGNEQLPTRAGQTYSSAMTAVGNAVANIVHRYGRGMLLIRKGKLHLGVRPMPLEGSAKALSFTNGLLASKKNDPAQATQPDNSQGGAGGDTPQPAEPPREQWTLTLKGRPDVMPGDIVTFHPPGEEVATTPTSVLGAVLGGIATAAGSLAPLLMDESSEPSITLYVNSVDHRLGRTSGFASTVTGVKVPDALGDGVWDHNAPINASDVQNAGANQGRSATGQGNAVAAIQGLAQNVAALSRNVEVGEVRSVTVTGTGSTEPPAQTERVWRGLVPPDGRANQVRRLAIRRHEPQAIDGVAYASPFAWGKVGLVLPRYPGTRVLLAHRNGEGADPVDIGAVWESGHGPETQAGDYWLILPVGVAQSDRTSIADSENPPTEHTASVTSDLIDADGNRVIEVGELAVRVTRNSLTQAGSRPARGSVQDGITIEHVDGSAKITIGSDGKITIHANQGLEIVAAQGDISITAQSGDVKLQGTNIDAQVSGQMNVH